MDKKVYIVIVGEYDERRNQFATTDLGKAIDCILEHYNYHSRPEEDRVSYFDEFNYLEIWNEKGLLYEYGAFISDKIYSGTQLSREELIEDIEEKIREYSK